MSLITCCPSCGTKFRVVADQLRISEGWVRCGRCQEVFDAQQAMVTDVVLPAAEPAAVASPALAGHAAVPAATAPAPAPSALAPRVAVAQPEAAVHSGYELPVPPEDDEDDALWEEPVPPAAPSVAPRLQPLPAATAPALPVDSAPPQRPVPPVWPRQAVDALEDVETAPAPAQPVVPVATPRMDPVAAPQPMAEALPSLAAPTPVEPVWREAPATAPVAPASRAPVVPTEDLGAVLEFPVLPGDAQQSSPMAREPQWDLPAALPPVSPPVWGDAARRVAAAAVAAGRAPEVPLPVVPLPAMPAPVTAAPSAVAVVPDAVDAFLDAPPAQDRPVQLAPAAATVAPTAAPVQALAPDAAELPNSEAALQTAVPAGAVDTDGADQAATEHDPQHLDPVLPDFVRQAQRKAWWNQPWVRFVMGMLVMLLPLALALQVVIHERNALVAWQPQWRGALESMCVALRCELAPYQDIRAVVVSDSSFAAAAEPHSYRLELGVRNRSGAAVAMPALELVLTDAQEQVLVRKVVLPSEMGAPPELAAHAEWTSTLPISTTGLNLPVFGYRLTVFYP